MSLTVPERNRAIKKLLETTYGKGCVSVTADRGTAYHWVAIKFIKKPEALLGQRYGETIAALEALIRGAGIHLSTYSDDMGGENVCISVTYARVPTCEHVWITDSTGLIDTCTACGEGRA